MLAPIWEAFRRWNWARRVLLLIVAPWLVLLAWMAVTGKPRWTTAAAVGVTAFMWLGFALAPFSENTEQTNASVGTTSTTAGHAEVSPATTAGRPSTTSTTSPTTTTAARVEMPAGEDTTVARMVDGDTIEVAGGERVRLIGVDTPEVHGGTECYGQQALLGQALSFRNERKRSGSQP